MYMLHTTNLSCYDMYQLPSPNRYSVNIFDYQKIVAKIVS